MIDDKGGIIMTFHGDYHVHTPFCPHGSNDEWELYIQQAIKLGLKEISFTEHAPLPRHFSDPVPEQDSAMSWSDLPAYFDQGEQLKKAYQDQIKVNIGFEIDYIDGYEDSTTLFLNQYGDRIEDSILSVHLLKVNDGDYVCLDYSAEEFGRIIDQFGSIDSVYQAYYDTVKKAVAANLGTHKPTRIGHLNLVEKFKKKYASQFNDEELIEQILQLIKTKGYSLDLNTAGLHKPFCESIYPNKKMIQRAIELNIPLIPGSDSHVSTTIARDFSKIKQYLNI